MAGRLRGTPKTGGRKAGTPNKRTLALRSAADSLAERIVAALGEDGFKGDAHALLVAVYKDGRQPIELRMQAAKAALPVEKPRLAAIETKFVDDLDGLSLEELEAIADGREEEFRRSRDAGGGGIGKRSPPLKRVK